MEVASLGRENVHVMVVVSLVEGEWLCYRGDHFNGGKMVRLWRWPVYWKENGHVTEVVSLSGGRIVKSYRGGQFDGGRMVMLRRWSV